MKFFKQSLMVAAVLLSTVSATEKIAGTELLAPEMHFHKWLSFFHDMLPHFDLWESIQNYWNMANMFKNRHYHRALKRPEPGPFTYNEEAESNPKVRGNLISDSWNVSWEFLLNMNEKTFWKIFAVYASYFMMPLVGGYVRAETSVQYNADVGTYQNSGISNDYLYLETMELFKMGFWGFFNLLDQNGGIYTAWE